MKITQLLCLIALFPALAQAECTFTIGGIDQRAANLKVDGYYLTGAG